MSRVEDPPLVRGEACFTDDLQRDNQLTMVVLRSPIAHGTIRKMDTTAAREMPGVVAVLTADDLQQHRIGPMNCRAGINTVDGNPMREPDRPVLASDHVHYLGEPVAAVIADTAYRAQDAIENIVLETDSQAAAIDAEQSARAKAPQIWPDIPDNSAFHWQKGDADTAALFERAAHTVELRVAHPRIAISPVETRACIAEYSLDSDSFTLTTPSQGVISLQRAIAGFMNISVDHLRVITYDTGGSFAVKIWPYPEHILALLAAKITNQPVKWTATRSESFIADAMGRGRIDRARLALDENGKFLAFSIDALADMGAYLNAVAPAVVTSGAVRPFGQCYDIPKMHYQVSAQYTNAVPTDAYRGAGKPESAATLERVIDVAARQLNIDPLELRRRNLITPQALPYDTPMQETYDGGNFPALASILEQKSDWAGLTERKNRSLQQGLLRGAGVAFYLHATGGSTQERSEVRALEDGSVLVRTGLQDNGQGHKTLLATVASETLQIPRERIRVEQGDTEWLAQGGGTGGSNLVPVAANTVHRAALEMIEKGKAITAELMETATADIEYGNGQFSIAGTDRVLSLAELPAAYNNASDQMRQLMPEAGCAGMLDFEGIHTTFPNGASVCEIELDPQTGKVRIDRYISIDDVGRVFDHQSTLGQLHGGIAQATGEVLLENVCYDSHGQLLCGSLMDYCLPRATDLPTLQTELTETDSPNSLLGAKGVGELTAIGAPGPIFNAVNDALASLGITHLDMPLTPGKIWQAINNAERTNNPAV